MRNPFRRRPTPVPEPTVPLTAEQEDELREVARTLLWPGFVELDHVENVIEDHEFESADPRALAAAAERIALEEWSRREAEIAATPGSGSYARLAAAFESLGSRGVLGRMSFTCCNTCGRAEIDDERTPLGPAHGVGYGFAEWAYVFFHEQDAERLSASSERLYLTYSAFQPAPDVDPADLAACRGGDPDARRRVLDQTDRIVGEMVRDALVAHGLEVTWDGTPDQRIEVSVPDWRKPLPRG